MVTANIRTADTAVDEELDYSRYNLGVRDLWSTGNVKAAEADPLSAGIDISSLLGGSSTTIDSVFSDPSTGTSTTDGLDSSAIGGLGAISANSREGTALTDNSGLIGNGAAAVAGDAAAAKGSNIGNFVTNALLGSMVNGLGPVGQLLNVGRKLVGFDPADNAGKWLGVNWMQKELKPGEIQSAELDGQMQQSVLDSLDAQGLVPGIDVAQVVADTLTPTTDPVGVKAAEDSDPALQEAQLPGAGVVTPGGQSSNPKSNQEDSSVVSYWTNSTDTSSIDSTPGTLGGTYSAPSSDTGGE